MGDDSEIGTIGENKICKEKLVTKEENIIITSV